MLAVNRLLGYLTAPWLYFRPYSKVQYVPDSQLRNDGTEMLNMVTPWWYCNTCHLYYATKGNENPKRVPMRNKFEGMYTRWHCDIGFRYLREKVAELYPDLRTLPSIEEALEWQSSDSSQRHYNLQRSIRL